MTDDKGFIDAYASMYDKKEEPQQQDEAIVTGSILAAKAAMGALKGAKVAGALGKAAKVAGKVSLVADAAGAVGDAAHKIRGKGQHHPDSQQEEVEVNEGIRRKIKVIGPMPADSSFANIKKYRLDVIFGM